MPNPRSRRGSDPCPKRNFQPKSNSRRSRGATAGEDSAAPAWRASRACARPATRLEAERTRPERSRSRRDRDDIHFPHKETGMKCVEAAGVAMMKEKARALATEHYKARARRASSTFVIPWRERRCGSHFCSVVMLSAVNARKKGVKGVEG